ncbi:MAG: ferritin-like domain-containing protein [Sphingorhabdus sp.]
MDRHRHRAVLPLEGSAIVVLSLGEACCSVLQTAEPTAKLMRARAVARDWRLGRIAHSFDAAMPDFPNRPAHPELLAPRFMPKRRRAGSERARIAMLHAFAHIEFVAIDLAFDLVGRFGAEFPREFADDWLHVGADEAMHFALLDRRLQQLGSHYGAMPAHDGLWEAAYETRHDTLARLAIVPMVLEARGLDVTPATITRFEAQGDSASARILNRIFYDEIRHVGAGTKWFESACRSAGANPVETWKHKLESHFRGSVKPPFNDSARSKAGLTRDYYAWVAMPEPDRLDP